MPPRTRPATRPDVLGVAAGAWLTRSVGRLEPGHPAKWVEVPAQVAQRMLPETARLVADLPREGSREVVWVAGVDELRVATDALALACRPLPILCGGPGEPAPAPTLSGITLPLPDPTAAGGTRPASPIPDAAP